MYPKLALRVIKAYILEIASCKHPVASVHGFHTSHPHRVLQWGEATMRLRLLGLGLFQALLLRSEAAYHGASGGSAHPAAHAGAPISESRGNLTGVFV